jgi:hypothetical protein
MKKILLGSLFVWVLMGCTMPSSLEDSSSASVSSLESSTSTASSSTSGSSSSSSTNAGTTVESKWLTSLGVQANAYNQAKPLIPTSLSSKGVLDMIHVLTKVDAELVGVSFESRVRGNSGNFTFRIGILNGKFGGFQTVNESEHGAFGDKVFNALRRGLAGKDATYQNVLQTYVDDGLNISTAEVTETLEEMMPSIAAMIDYYDETIAVLSN